MNNKLKDNEIIKALEEYVKENEFEYFHSNTMGEYPLIRKALNFINRLQSQNKDLSETVHNIQVEKDTLFDKCEELKKEVVRLNNLQKVITRQQAEIERLQEAIDEQDIEISRLYKRIDEAKAEAYKEFCEKRGIKYVEDDV